MSIHLEGVELDDIEAEQEEVRDVVTCTTAKTVYQINDATDGNQVEDDNRKTKIKELHKKLFYYSKNLEFEKALKHLTENKKEFDEEYSEINQVKDTERTAVHYAANDAEGEQLFQQLIALQNYSGLSNAADKSGRTPMHLSARHHSEKQFKANFGMPLSDSKLQMTDVNGATCLHYAARNENCCDIFKTVIESVPDCLMWRRKDNVTVLDIFMRYAEKGIEQLFDEDWRGLNALRDAIKDVRRSLEDLKDFEGNTVLHKAASNKMSLATFLDYQDKLKHPPRTPHPYFTWHNNFGKTVLHIALEMCSPATLKTLLETIESSDLERLVKLQDKEKNTMAHDAANNESSKVLQILADHLGSWNFLAWRNSSKQSVLHFAVKHYGNIDALLGEIKRLKTEWTLNYVDNDGNTLLHSLFQTNRDVDDVEAFWKAAESLVKAGVDQFAEHHLKDTGSGLQLSDETDSGLSCVDFADASEKLDELIDAVFPDEEDCDEDADSNYDDNASERSREITRQSSLTDVNFIRLLDKRTGALRLPSRTKAKDCLASIEASIASEDLSAKEQNKSNERSDMSILIKAIKSDSPEIYRCALKLCRVTAETEADFPEFYRERLFDISNEYELGNPRIAKSEGKSEQLQLLYSKVISVAMNALDALYSNADEEERQLLFQYITGSLWDDDWETTGPKFPCRMENGSTKPYTLMEMIEEAGDGDLFASDCLHNLIESEWSNAYSRYRRNCCKRKFSVKPRIKFWIHLISFLAYNVFIAWYIMDLPTTFKFWPADLVMIAYLLSFTLQEVLDICTRSKRRRAKICGIEIKKCPVYFKDVLNLLDCSALILMWAGLLLKLAMWGCIFNYVTGVDSSSMCSETNSTAYQALFRGASANRTWTQPTPYSAYACQMVLSTAFLLWGFRSVAFLATRSESVFMLPLNLLFTNFDVLPTETAKDKDQVLREVAHHLGYKWFSRVMMFVFLLLSNIVMINLLIARFSLTFRRIRPQLARVVTRNKSDSEALVAHVENLVSTANRDLHDRLGQLEEEINRKFALLQEAISKKKIMANSGIKAGATETQEDKLQGLREDVETLLHVIVEDLPEKYRQDRQENKITHETEKNLVELINAQDSRIKAKLSSQPKHNKLWKKKFDEFSELSIINVAIAIDKVNILLELVLSRRHDLLPACITLLIKLRPKIASKKGNEKKLKELCADVSNLAMKCLDELYSRAEEDNQKQLLFGYIKGSFPDSAHDTKGPKFPCQLGANALKYFTLLEMIDMCGEGDLYATECLHRLINEEWDPPKKKSPKESNETEGSNVFMLPLNLLFTNFDVLPTETAKDKDQVLGEVAHHLGYKWFSRVMMFVFLLLSNIVMINLLIARFSLTVSRMDSKSVEIWRKRNVELLREYQSCSPVPAPLSFIHYIYKIFQWCQKRRNNAVHPENTQEGLIEETWSKKPKDLESYEKYLEFQTKHLQHILSQQQSRKFMHEGIDEDVKRYLNHLVKSATRDMLSDMLKVLQSSVGTDDPAGHIKISGANQTTSST
uniref:ANK_REP_REGION domain-containing protein n=1 Tax=Macrostomum lignano TaxID=282301 RepID=A0A1I8G2X0_9PLAT